MHRNTYFVVTVLAVFAALIVGVNVGRSLRGNPQNTLSASSTPTPTQAVVVGPKMLTYTDTTCRITFQYPDSLTKMSDATGSALFIDSATNTQVCILACQRDIPRPALPANEIESKILTDATETASVSAKLYHDASPKDGTPIDSLIFRNPKTGLDVFIAGYGDTFNQILASLKLLP